MNVARIGLLRLLNEVFEIFRGRRFRGEVNNFCGDCPAHYDLDNGKRELFQSTFGGIDGHWFVIQKSILFGLPGSTHAWQSGAISRDTMFELFRRGEILSDRRTNHDEEQLIKVARAGWSLTIAFFGWLWDVYRGQRFA